MIRLVVADDHPVVLEGVVRFLEREPDLEVVARCNCGDAALLALRERQPDVMLLDLNMPKVSGMDVLRQAADEDLHAQVILLTGDLSNEQLLEAVRLGARGVVLKDSAPDVLIRAIRTVHSGGQWLEPHFAAVTVEQLLAHTAKKQHSPSPLSAREAELVQLVMQGLRNKEVGFRLGITEGTVKIHLHRIYEKLGVNNRMDLANYVRQHLS
jgi:two-component system nitrate/nitrite response regulator NarL